MNVQDSTDRHTHTHTLKYCTVPKAKFVQIFLTPQNADINILVNKEKLNLRKQN